MGERAAAAKVAPSSAELSDRHGETSASTFGWLAAGNASLAQAMTAGGSAAGRSGQRVDGPLPPGQLYEDADVLIIQRSADDVEIRVGGATVGITAPAVEDRYSFHLDPPERGSFQRVLRISRTVGVVVTTSGLGGGPDDAELVVHELIVEGSETTSSLGPTAEPLVLEFSDGASIQLDEAIVAIRSVDADALFAFEIQPGWTGADRREKLVTVVATPGVSVHEDALGGQMAGIVRPGYGRRLRAEIIRVQDPALVPARGAHIDAASYVGDAVVGGPGAASAGGEGLIASTGMAGVTIRDEQSGGWVRLSAKDPTVGAAFAYEVVDRERSSTQSLEINVVVGPGVVVELVEPLDAAMAEAGPPSIGPGAAFTEAGAAFRSRGILLQVAEVDDAASVPSQGQSVDVGIGRPRRPDVIRRESTVEQTVAMAVHDVALGFVPGIGDVNDATEFASALATGRDRWGRDVTGWEVALMGVGTVLPLVGSAALRRLFGRASALGGAGTGGRSVDELDAAVGTLPGLSTDDRAVIDRVRDAVSRGDAPAADDVRRAMELRSAGTALPRLTGSSPLGDLSGPAAASMSLPQQASNWEGVRGLVGTHIDDVELPEGYSRYEYRGRTIIRRQRADDGLVRLAVDENGLIQIAQSSRRSRASTTGFINGALRKIQADPKHPLRFLLVPDEGAAAADEGAHLGWRTTRRITKKGVEQRGRYPGNEEGVVVQVGHQGAFSAGGAERFMLEDAELNILGGETIESLGAFSFKEAVLIGDVPVDVASAMLWERLDLLPAGTVAGGSRIAAPDLP